MTLNQSPVMFCDDPHGYTYEGEQLHGITDLIRDVVGLGYAKADTTLPAIRRAGEYGTAVHKAIKDYEDDHGFHSTLFPMSEEWQAESTDLWDVRPELDNYIKLSEGFETLATEYTVSDCQRYASNIDTVWRKRETGGIWLADTKTNNLKYYPGGEDKFRDYLSWQLSIYAYLFEKQNPGLKVEGLLCNWLRGDDCRQIEIKRLPDEYIKAILSTPWMDNGDGTTTFFPHEAMNEIVKAFRIGNALEANDDISETHNRIRHIREAIATLKEEEDVLTSQVRVYMGEATEVVRIVDGKPVPLFTWKRRKAADRIDSKRLKKDHPDIYAAYSTPGGETRTFLIK